MVADRALVADRAPFGSQNGLTSKRAAIGDQGAIGAARTRSAASIGATVPELDAELARAAGADQDPPRGQFHRRQKIAELGAPCRDFSDDRKFPTFDARGAAAI